MKKTLLLIAVTPILASCTRKDATPSAVVSAFFEAGKAGDTPASLKYLQEKDRVFLERMEQRQDGKGRFVPRKGLEYTVEGESIEGDTATVTVTTVHEGKAKTDTLKLLRENGKWRIDLVPDEMLEAMEGILKVAPSSPK